MKKIKDERLILQMLKNIRIVFLFEYIGVVGILGYIGFTEGIDQITKSPLWLLFMLTSILLAYLQLSVSIDVEEGVKLTPYYKLVFRSLIVGIVMAIIYIIFSPERPLFEAILTGSILFICFLVSYSVSYFIKKRRLQDNDE
ncbi:MULTISPECIES: branched-chain amino acid ABC transporter substrate-binding protein [Bacillus cereus group]|uniref:branched-chain amino acid ABC transporter substrate-binding protein n=1 Tax=Bacillus cereus group TaxID=86661 RepID=UPI001298A015|nr:MULTISPECIES: branched-chain amino acid ABC transporter substrate-binding protein [Bacillus cereus group]MCR6785540.1 branched-chain amino acid ABC transporter substrate-binding protein [Bacillus thuringiensis]MCR6825172.1 branched-chain amino acid ABC transporter substrate-binding protein [Bacillus thuringiensis]MCR6827045.1 branched-chain amino acid ABC transporter substrate-binding protein [Bacillus thuringiensis]MEB8930508.1 branched-chain amino acid ABC transporter substrate-binding pro